MSQSKSKHSVQEQARELFRHKAGKDLTHQETQENVANLTGFFGVLREWERQKQMAANAEKVMVAAGGGSAANVHQH